MSDANRARPFGHYEARFATPLQGSWLIGLMAGACVLLSFGGDIARVLLRYDRGGIVDAHEYWRLLTGHFVHGSPTHMALNLAGLGLMALLFPRHYSLTSWLVISGSSLAAIDIGFVFFEPHLDWYVGLSGLLHGVLAAGAMAWWRYESKALASLLTLILVVKLTWEQTQGALPFSGDMRVIVDAHLYGALGGAFAGASIWCGQHRWPWQPRPL